MTHDTWLDLGPLADFPEGRPVLRKAGGQRFACVRAGGAVHALDDRCPHQGYPLSQGTCRDGVLTCEWHNWKFELASGECTFGGEAVRRYPTRVEDGRVHLHVAVDVGREAARLRAGLAQALVRDEMGRALREALRLGPLVPHPHPGALGPLAAGFEQTIQDGARRAEYGFDHGLAVLTDLAAWAERGWVGKEEAFVAAAHAVAEPSLHLPARAVPPEDAAGALDPARVAEALAAERRDEAEALVRATARERGPRAAVAAVLPFVARHLLDYGHGAIFTAKAAEIAARFPAVAEDVFGALAVSLAWATAETALPPFAATRAALARVDGMQLPGAGDGRLEGGARAAFEAAILSGESAGVGAAVEQLARGVAARELLRAAAHAAAERLARFDPAWEERLDAEVSVLDVTHTVTFAESALALTEDEDADPRSAARLAVLAAGFVGKVRLGDRADAGDPAPRGHAPDLLAAASARDPGRAIAIAREMSAAERRAAYAQLAPFAAFDTSVRPIRYAHAVKMTEALHRLDRDDPAADGTYLRALLAYLVPVRREWHPRRVGYVAAKFLADGRPPENLY